MAAEVDALDYKIMHELYLNSRVPLSALARKLRMSKQRVNYRIQKLLKEGSIKAFITMTDRARIGYTYDMFCYETSPFSERQEQAVFRKLLALNPTILFKCEGKWNIMAGFVEKSIYDLAQKQQQMRFILRGHIIKEYHLLHMQSLRYRMPQSDEDVHSPIFSSGKKTDVISIDDKDVKVLRALSNNARASYLELSKMLRMPPETIRYRMKQLQKNKAILGFSISVDPNLHGMHHYRVYVNLSIPNRQTLEKILSHVSSIPQVTRIITLVSDYDFCYDAVVDGGVEIRKIKAALSHKFFRNIVEQEAIRVYEEYRYSHFPIL